MCVLGGVTVFDRLLAFEGVAAFVDRMTGGRGGKSDDGLRNSRWWVRPLVGFV